MNKHIICITIASKSQKFIHNNKASAPAEGFNHAHPHEDEIWENDITYKQSVSSVKWDVFAEFS